MTCPRLHSKERGGSQDGNPGSLVPLTLLSPLPQGGSALSFQDKHPFQRWCLGLENLLEICGRAHTSPPTTKHIPSVFP